jgi:pimeloyl-ACP methyl ester carboxylesterase
MKPRPPVQPPVGGFRDVRGRRLFVHTEGRGSPAVAFLAGAGLVGLDYLAVQRRAAEHGASLVYDRAGTGWSEPVRMPRTSAEVTDELHAILAAVGIAGPIVLVGHSLGGLYARHYAARFPDDVVGLVLLDPAHENYDAYMPEELNDLRRSSARFKVLAFAADVALGISPARALLARTPAIQRYRRLYRELFAQEMAGWPGPIRDLLVERHGSIDWLAAGMREARDIDERYAEVARAGAMPDVPLIVLSSMSTDGFKDAVSMGESPSLIREEIEAKLRLYRDIASSVPRGEVRPLDAGHVTMALRCPNEVARAIQDVLRLGHAPHA